MPQPAEHHRLAEAWDTDVVATDPLDFPGYRSASGAAESVTTGVAEVAGHPVVVIQSRFENFGGTMGVATGERLVRAFDRATERGLPVAAFVASGGARLQEGMFSLIQMARTASAVRRHRDAGLMFVAVLRPHTTGGVYASWASLADVIAAEAGAIVAFAGPRVVDSVTGSYPPPGSNTAEAAFESGRVDALVTRSEQWEWVGEAVFGPTRPSPVVTRRRPMPRASGDGDAWPTVERARAATRPSGLEWAGWLCEGWLELRGADPSMRAGIGRLSGVRCVVVAMDRHAHGDGRARQRPTGFRFARRAIELADRLGLPVLTLVDTPGADPAAAAEADDVAGEIARTLLAMATVSVPTVAVCVGEGGSGAAMALAHTDRLYLLDGAVFSVIGPEAAAAILHRDADAAPSLARDMRITAADLLDLGIIDAVCADSDVGGLRALIVEAFRTAQPGDRDVRIDRISRSNLNWGESEESSQEVAGQHW